MMTGREDVERIAEIRVELEKPIQSQFIREHVRWLLEYAACLEARLAEVERERDEWQMRHEGLLRGQDRLGQAVVEWKDRALAAEARLTEVEQEFNSDGRSVHLLSSFYENLVRDAKRAQAAEARVVELEGALRGMLELDGFRPRDGSVNAEWEAKILADAFAATGRGERA